MGWLRAAPVVVCLVGLMSACQPDPATARGTAERFLDAHYVRIDLPAARAYCTGFALSRIEEEIRLTQGQPIDAATRPPRVYYNLKETTPRGESRTSFVYELDFLVEGAGRFTKNVVLTLQRRAEGWRVVNYLEYD